MKGIYFVFLGFLILTLTSCVEIIDDLSINADGSGTFKYTVNLSSSKVKINSILALDSLDGKKVPSLDEIKAQITDIIESFKQKEGISNVTFDANYDDFMFKMTCDFSSVSLLQSAIKEVVKEETKSRDLPELDYNWVSLEDNVLMRSIPKITIEKAKEINQSESDLLKEGTYTSITRFKKEIVEYKNENAVLSKNKMAIMIRTDPFSLIQDQSLLDNTIYLSEEN